MKVVHMATAVKWMKQITLASAAIFLTCALALAQSDSGPQPKPKKEKQAEPLTTRLHIVVTGVDTNKPVANASVYVRFDQGRTLFHGHKEAELNLKTNQDGSVKVPPVPRGKVLIQVVAPGWHTFGKYYELTQQEESIQIKLEKPPRWY